MSDHDTHERGQETRQLLPDPARTYGDTHIISQSDPSELLLSEVNSDLRRHDYNFKKVVNGSSYERALQKLQQTETPGNEGAVRDN
jgi:hypothetical protein